MGFIDFVKNAGSKIFGGGDDDATKAEAESTADANQAAATALKMRVQRLGLDVESLKIAVNGDMAVVSGTTKSQTDREKIILVVGNTHGIARVDDSMIVDEPEPEALYYTVKRGDTLSNIAKEHYGSAMKYPVIFVANKPMLSNPDKIYPGQMLRIPALND